MAVPLFMVVCGAAGLVDIIRIDCICLRVSAVSQWPPPAPMSQSPACCSCCRRCCGWWAGCRGGSGTDCIVSDGGTAESSSTSTSFCCSSGTLCCSLFCRCCCCCCSRSLCLVRGSTSSNLCLLRFACCDGSAVCAQVPRCGGVGGLQQSSGGGGTALPEGTAEGRSLRSAPAAGAPSAQPMFTGGVAAAAPGAVVSTGAFPALSPSRRKPPLARAGLHGRTDPAGTNGFPALIRLPKDGVTAAAQQSSGHFSHAAFCRASSGGSGMGHGAPAGARSRLSVTFGGSIPGNDHLPSIATPGPPPAAPLKAGSTPPWTKFGATHGANPSPRLARSSVKASSTVPGMFEHWTEASGTSSSFLECTLVATGVTMAPRRCEGDGGGGGVDPGSFLTLTFFGGSISAAFGSWRLPLSC
jgi:hypothetical protein